MPQYYEDKEDDARACAGIREDFKACLLQHDCVVKCTLCFPSTNPLTAFPELKWVLEGKHLTLCTRWGIPVTSAESYYKYCYTLPPVDPPQFEGKKPSECLKEGHCRGLQVSFFECKRSMLDTRSRFRGRKGY